MSRARSQATDLVVFLGPTLDEAEARKIARMTVLPPARQGDVWRAMELLPRAIVLIDGVFEAQPSVWHGELLSAMAAGVEVFGASSMGALRAAELDGFGMRGVGHIYESFRSGALVDDAEVALLHASAEFHFRPLTVPLVNVRHAALQALRHEVLSRREAAALIKLAEATFYQERTWPKLVASAGAPWTPSTRLRWKAFEEAGLPDLKRDDAVLCLLTAARWLPEKPSAPGSRLPVQRPSSLVRRERLFASASNGSKLEALARADALGALARSGLTRSVLATLGRALGLEVSEAELADEERAWRKRLGSRAGDSDFFVRMGMDAGDGRRLCEDAVLAERLLQHSARLLPDAISPDEARASEARWTGVWPGRPRKRGGRP